MSKPITSMGIEYLGVPYWVEVEGYEKIEVGYSGDFGRTICRITGDKTPLDSMKRKTRYWMIEGGPPTREEREAIPWEE